MIPSINMLSRSSSSLLPSSSNLLSLASSSSSSFSSLASSSSPSSFSPLSSSSSSLLSSSTNFVPSSSFTRSFSSHGHGSGTHTDNDTYHTQHAHIFHMFFTIDIFEANFVHCFSFNCSSLPYIHIGFCICYMCMFVCLFVYDVYVRYSW